MSGQHPRPAVVIAIGGAGLRIGGGKPDRMLGGRRLIDHAIDWARGQSDHVALAGAPGSRRDERGLPWMADRAADLGPIAALASAMHFAAARQRSHVLLIGCDTPFLPSDLACSLEAALGGAGAALPRHDDRLHTMAGLWRTAPDTVEAWIAGGGRSLWGYAESVGLITVDWPANEVDPFANINTPNDLAAAEARLRAGGR